MSHRKHGTRAMYVQEKCRCEPCKEANRAYARNRDRATRRPDERRLPAYISAGAVRAHVAELSAAGLGYKRVAKVAGVSGSTLFKVVSGQRDRIHRDTATKVLAVTPSAASDFNRVDAGPTWALIEQLLAAGVTKARIGQAIAGPQAHSLQLRRDRIAKRSADAVARLAAEILPDHETDTDRLARLRAEATDVEQFQTAMADVLEARLAPWRAQAACNHAGIPTTAFFVERGTSIATARSICARCPVTTECLDEAMSTGQRVGVWGGQSQHERRDLAGAAA